MIEEGGAAAPDQTFPEYLLNVGSIIWLLLYVVTKLITGWMSGLEKSQLANAFFEQRFTTWTESHSKNNFFPNITL